MPTPIADEQRAVQALCDEETRSLGLRCQIERQYFEWARWRIRVFREDDHLFDVASADLEELRELLKEWVHRVLAPKEAD